MKAIIWDMGGVLVRTHSQAGRRKWEQALNLPALELERVVFASESARQAGLGKISVDDHWGWILDHYGIPHEQRDELERDFWSGDEVDHDLVSNIGRLKTRYLTGLITNAWLDIRHMLEDVWGINAVFDEIVISAEVGLAKPDPAIYEMMLDRLNIEPAEAVFIDDFLANINAAQELGMHTIHFQQPSLALQQLDSLLAEDK